MSTLTEASVQSSTVTLYRRSTRTYEEHYPVTCRKAERGRFEERLKMLGSLTEEITEAEEEVKI